MLMIAGVLLIVVGIAQISLSIYMLINLLKRDE